MDCSGSRLRLIYLTCCSAKVSVDSRCQRAEYLNVDRSEGETMPRRWVVFALATVLFSVMPAIPVSAAGPTYVTSHISGNVTWTRTGEPYIVNIPTLWVQPGATLTIQPGVRVVMNQPLGVLEVKGNLQAIGTRNRPIVFTSGQDYYSGGTGAAKGQWRYISFVGAGTGNLNHVEIKYAGYLRSDFAPWAYTALLMNSSLDVWVTNSKIHDNNNSGVMATANVPIHISSTLIYNNDIGVSVVGSTNGVVEIDHSGLYNNSVYGLFTNHSSTPFMQSFITQSNISGNLRTGVRLQEGASTPAERYPTGDFNNIWNNGGGVDQLTVLNPRINANEDLWGQNYWGGTHWLAVCPWAQTFWQYHLAHISHLFPVTDKGPIGSMLWSFVDPNGDLHGCRTDDLRVETFSNEPYDWVIPDP
jgi:hypothetical protein